ncbi:DapH/DapD/GlmU-related protein [Micromonospora sp. DSM 115977]|uniref:DapH/DapD/GlmU-related protein n=1 Tax=Micromonospora reichwaldensis TaxID=3075516 RepID=A0ABU2WPT3_9ACTN|nr:DapH/DapD/GlmU-related protein [Micromonospora sp. DSM 115977]MDT0527588.1 DapH/DapD/GlmU-related protein [Micromonospora sp. DSM 115977]
MLVGPKATFITVGHPVDPEERRGWLSGGPIDVAENVWIGAGATILPGVSIGRDAVVAAGAVVAEDVPPASLVREDDGHASYPSGSPAGLRRRPGRRATPTAGPAGSGAAPRRTRRRRRTGRADRP